MICEHRYLDAPGGLVCTRETHTDGGHTYVASDAPDAHDLSESAAERSRG